MGVLDGEETKVITVRLSEQQHTRAREAASVAKTSLNKLCVSAINAAVDAVLAAGEAHEATQPFKGTNHPPDRFAGKAGA